MNYTFAAISIFGFLICGMAAVLVLVRDSMNRLNRSFAVFAVFSSAYNLLRFMVLVSKNPSLAQVYFLAVAVLFPFVIASLVYFLLVFSEKENTWFRGSGLVFVCAPLFPLTYLSLLPNFFYGGLVKTIWGYSERFGPYYPLVVGYAVFYMVFAVGLAWYSLRQAKLKRDRKQRLIVLSGVTLAFLSGIFTDVVLPEFGLRPVNMIPTALMIYVVFLSFAMVRYGFMLITPAMVSQDIITAMPDFIIMGDENRKIIFVNRSFLEFTGSALKEIVGKEIEEVFSDKKDKPICEELALLEKNGEKLKNYKRYLAGRSNNNIPVMVSGKNVKDRFGEKIGSLYLLHDISNEESLLGQQEQAIDDLSHNKERMLSLLEDTTRARDEAHRRSDEIEKLYEDLKKVDKMKTEFLSVISHELRTPLTPIKGYTDVLLSDVLGKLTDPQKKAIITIQKESQHLLGLIDSLLDASRMERGRSMEIEKEPMLLRVLVEDLKEVFGPQLEAREIKLSPDISKDFSTIMADPVKMRRLLSNLIGNAVKFTPKGGAIKIKASVQDNFVRVEVIDTGIGMAKEYLEKAFDRFFQIDTSYTRAVGGAGLGLAIAREIVLAHGGKIWIESEGPGRGCNVIFILPIA